MRLTVIKPAAECSDSVKRLDKILSHALEGAKTEFIETSASFGCCSFSGKRLLFAVALDDAGMNMELQNIQRIIRLNRTIFDGCVAGVAIDGTGEMYTKSIARELVYDANMSGCRFPGKHLVEATGMLYNYNTLAKKYGVDNYTAYAISVEKLVRRIADGGLQQAERGDNGAKRPRLLALHASSRKTSNTLLLWDMVKKHINDIDIEEISLANINLSDCEGCSYTKCKSYGERSTCCIDDFMAERVYPAIEACDGVVMICPNYNDCLGANLVAFVNRLTSLFRKRQFYEKCLFGIIVSGYSGGNLIAEQLIGSMCMNKSFCLPPRFCMQETANERGSILQVENIEQRAEGFAKSINARLKERII